MLVLYIAKTPFKFGEYKTNSVILSRVQVKIHFKMNLKDQIKTLFKLIGKACISFCNLSSANLLFILFEKSENMSYHFNFLRF